MTDLQDSAQSPPEGVFDAYHRWYYDTGVYLRTTYRGVPCLKSVSDMWNYQEILSELRPGLVVEFGSYHGGATLFFADTLRTVNPKGRVLAVELYPDNLDTRVRRQRGIEVMECSSTDPAVARRIGKLRAKLRGPVFAILDSDHTKEHVLGELELLRDVLRSGDYVVVEDSNINGHPVLSGWGPGPMEALDAYWTRHPDDYVRDEERERKFGFTFAPRGFLIRR